MENKKTLHRRVAFVTSLSLSLPPSASPALSLFYSLHLSFLYGRLCGCLICGETNDSDSPNLAQYQSHSESITSRERACVSAQVCMCPALPITPLGSVVQRQKALIFQFYHTPLSQLSHSCSLPYHPHSAFFFHLTDLSQTHTHIVCLLISSQSCLMGQKQRRRVN